MKALLLGRLAPAVCVLVLTLPGAARQASADIEVGQPLPELSLYTNVGTSFRPNIGPDAFAVARAEPFEPETGIGYEVGAKLDLFGGALGIRRTYILHARGAKLPTDLLGLTGQLAYFFLLFFFPFLIFLVSLTGLVMGNPEAGVKSLFETLTGLVPTNARTLVVDYVDSTLRSAGTGALVLGT